MSNPAAVPTPVTDVVGDGRWISQHNRFIVEARKKEPEVLIVGDSIVQLLTQDEIWDKMFVPLHCLNFGIGGDQTQHVLWRLKNGELEGFAPKVIVILVGTNNQDHTIEQIVDGLMEIARTCRTEQPQANVIVMGIPPRGQYDNPLRHKIAAINANVAEKIHQLDKRDNVYFFDVDPRWFIGADGAISHHDMYDYLHLTRAGYRKLAEPLLEEIQAHLKHFMTADLISPDTE
jgi:platelet-activating factor acetylhydrolase IB subunit beta/gamma